jgi:flagellar hook-basal body complex protein FliE
MTVSTFNALRGYGAAGAASTAAKPQDSPQAAAGGQTAASFSAVHALAANLAVAETKAQALIAGGADPHSVIQALAQAELAVETAVVIRDKVVEAYQEILRMPV